MKRYHPDFPALMQLCESNFAQLSRLLPKHLELGHCVQYQVAQQQYLLRVVETTRYTSLVIIDQLAAPRYCGLPSITVRLYYDVLVAEVCASQQISRFKSRYDYPNRHLHQRDEKHQINQFLADWLRYCLKHGVALVC